MRYVKHTLLVAALGVMVVLGAGACSGTSDVAAPGTTLMPVLSADDLAVTPGATVPATMPIPDGFVAPDTRNVRIAPVIGRPQPGRDPDVPTLPMEGGGAKLHGTVVDPEGHPAEGATVRLERFAGDEFGRLDVATNKDGRWLVQGLVGGRYRVRAWVRPSLTVTTPQAVFLIDKDGDANLDFTLEPHDGTIVQGALDEAEPRVGRPAVFRGLVAKETVDDNGIVRAEGIPDAWVQLSALEGLKVIGPDLGQTGPDGFIIFSVACLAPGGHSVIIDSSFQAHAIGLPACLDGNVDDLPPDVATFAVGSQFTVPFAGPVPPGTYTTTTSTPGAACGTSYEEYVDGGWTRTSTLAKVITTTGVSRSFDPVDGTPACTFKRTA